MKLFDDATMETSKGNNKEINIFWKPSDPLLEKHEQKTERHQSFFYVVKYEIFFGGNTHPWFLLMHNTQYSFKVFSLQKQPYHNAKLAPLISSGYALKKFTIIIHLYTIKNSHFTNPSRPLFKKFLKF